MKIRTSIKAGRIALNHDQVIVIRKRRLQGGFR
jgi:hypothetical protein